MLFRKCVEQALPSEKYTCMDGITEQPLLVLVTSCFKICVFVIVKRDNFVIKEILVQQPSLYIWKSLREYTNNGFR